MLILMTLLEFIKLRIGGEEASDFDLDVLVGDGVEEAFNSDLDGVDQLITFFSKTSDIMMSVSDRFSPFL